MRVLMLGWEFPPYVSGGLGRHCYELTRCLVNLGTDITFFMPKKGADLQAHGMEIVGVPPTPRNKKNPGYYEAAGSPPLLPYPIRPYGPEKPFPKIGPYEYVPPQEQQAPSGGKSEQDTIENYPLDFFEAVVSYNRSLVHEAMEKDFDVIHAHDWITMLGGIETKKRTGKPLIVTVHSTEFDRTADIYPMEWIVEIEKQGIKHADRIIAVSKMTKEHLVQKYGADENKIRVVYNAVNPKDYKREVPEKKEKIVLFAGRLTNQKGPIFFLRTAKEVIDHDPEQKVRFIVCGKGDLLPHLIEEAVHMGLSGHVTFTGYISDEELIRVYNSADVYVLPSVSEPFGITVLEAMSANTPVIISKTSGVSEVISHCLKVDFWDTNEMANKIISILRHKPLKECMTENAGKEVNNFDWNKIANDTLKVYREVFM